MSDGIAARYAKLAAIAPGKPKRPRPKRKKKGAAKKFDWHGHYFHKLAVPEGTLRYYLRVPANRADDAQAAGCQYDPASHRWYVDNPPNLADFASWKPSRVGLEKLIKQLKRHHSQESPSG